MIFTPRHDEQNAVEAVLECLKIQGNLNFPQIVYEPNGAKKAPDYLFHFTTHSVIVEVRNSGDGFLVLPEPKHLVPKESYERSAANMVDKIEELVKIWLDPTETIILMITSPIPLQQRGRLAKKISKQLENAYLNKTLSFSQRIELKVDTGDVTLPLVHVEAKLTNYYAGKKEYSTVKEILGASLQSPYPVFQASLSEQARYTLCTALSEKKEKLTHLEGEKWLVLVNNNPLLDEALYSAAYTEILEERQDLKIVFSKTFLVEGKTAKELKAT
jgi:hypothetical protein